MPNQGYPLWRCLEQFESEHLREIKMPSALLLQTSAFGVQCCQSKFNYFGTLNQECGSFLNSKGYSARVVCEWLMDVCPCVPRRTWPVGNRTLGNDIMGLVPDDRLYLSEVALTHGCHSTDHGFSASVRRINQVVVVNVGARPFNLWLWDAYCFAQLREPSFPKSR